MLSPLLVTGWRSSSPRYTACNHSWPTPLSTRNSGTSGVPFVTCHMACPPSLPSTRKTGLRPHIPFLPPVLALLQPASPPRHSLLAQPGPTPPTPSLPTRVPPPAPPMLPSTTQALVCSTKPQPKTPLSVRPKARAPVDLGPQRPKSRPSWRPLLRRALLPSPALPEGSTPPADLMPLTLMKP